MVEYMTTKFYLMLKDYKEEKELLSLINEITNNTAGKMPENSFR